jgi:hypothetical protein
MTIRAKNHKTRRREQTSMPRAKRLRRVVILCTNFVLNAAYHRAGLSQGAQALRSDFWTQANANFVDMAVLEWCKLLSDRDDKHHWRNIVTDPAAFKAKLLARLEMTPTELLKLIKDMGYYRNKFVAHLDSVEVMNVPPLSKALEAVNCYHEQIVTEEASAGDLRGLVDTAEKFAKLYAHCSQKAGRVYSHAVKG